MNLENQTALITGSSGGIGEDFAVAFAQRKVNLVLVARRVDNSSSCAPGCWRSARGSPSTSSPPTSRCPDRRPNWQPR